jgi:hypothetical protein
VSDVPDSFDCPMCAEPVPDSLTGVMTHVLNRWHNPIPALRHELAHRPVFTLTALATSFVLGAGVVAVIIRAGAL